MKPTSRARKRECISSCFLAAQTSINLSLSLLPRQSGQPEWIWIAGADYFRQPHWRFAGRRASSDWNRWTAIRTGWPGGVMPFRAEMASGSENEKSETETGKEKAASWAVPITRPGRSKMTREQSLKLSTDYHYPTTFWTFQHRYTDAASSPRKQTQ